jgi:putative DNA primase/helicase
MSDGRLRIDADEPLHRKTKAAWAALVKADADERADDPSVIPNVLVRGDQLVRMKESGELEAIPLDSLRERISEAAQFERTSTKGTKAVDPPIDVAKTLLSWDASKYEGAPTVERIVDVPILGPDGHLITEPGHHPGSGIFYRPAPDLVGVGPLAADSTEDVEWAVQFLLDDYLHDFGFVDKASRAQALGLMLLPFVREFIPGPTPLHGIFAPQDGSGSGKTWLAQACFAPSSGEVEAMPGAGTDDAEWRKRITSTLLEAPGAILLDNLSGSLDSSALASALTTGLWKDRILGENRVATLPVRNAWAATGNGPKVSEEHVRRIVPIFLDPGDVRPADRQRSDFRHPDLLGWAAENRRDLVVACLTLVKHWLNGAVEEVEGGYIYVRGSAPLQGTKTLGSYERWAGVVGGILEAAGMEGFLENRDDLNKDAIADARITRGFFAGLRELSGGEPWQTRDIASHCAPGGRLFDFLVPDLAEALPIGHPAAWDADDSKRFNQALAAWMTDRKWRQVGSLTLGNKKLPVKGRPLGWFVQDAAAGAAPADSA